MQRADAPVCYSSDSSYLRNSTACVCPTGLTRHLEHEDFVLERDDVLVLYKKKTSRRNIRLHFLYLLPSPQVEVWIHHIFVVSYRFHNHIQVTALLPNIRNTNTEKTESCLHANKTCTASIQDQRQPQRNSIGRKDISTQNYYILT